MRSGSPRAVALAGVGHATPRLEVAPASLAFGQQEIGTQSAARPVRLRNSGNTTIEIQRVTVQGSDAFRLQDRCANARLAPGAECAIDVRFAPTTIESSSGRIVIANSAGGARGVDLAGNGFGKPAIEVAPTQVDFGTLKRGTASQPRRVTIGNTGSAALLLQAPRIDGDRRFSMANACPDRLAPKARCSVDIGVEASGTGRLAARLLIAHNAAGTPTAVSLLAAIEAIPPPVIDSFVANPAALQGPRDVELCFRARFAQRLTVEPGGPQPQSNAQGCVARSVKATTTFTLIATGEGGTRQESRTVVVAPPPPPQAPVIVEFRADPVLLRERGATRLCFTARNAEIAVIAPGEPQPSSPNGGCVSRGVSVTTTFVLTVSRAGAAPQRREATVTVIPPLRARQRRDRQADAHGTDVPSRRQAAGRCAERRRRRHEGSRRREGRSWRPGRQATVGWCCTPGKAEAGTDAGLRVRVPEAGAMVRHRVAGEAGLYGA